MLGPKTPGSPLFIVGPAIFNIALRFTYTPYPLSSRRPTAYEKL